MAVIGVTNGVIGEGAARGRSRAPLPFPARSGIEPLAVLIFGDSNAAAIGGADPTIQTKNNNVRVFATPGTGSAPQDPALMQWRVVDPNAALVTDLVPPVAQPNTDCYVGILRASNGSTGYAIADRLQQRTGRDTYLASFVQGGVTNQFWQPGGTLNTLPGTNGMLKMEAHMPTLLSTIPNGAGYFDVVYFSGGGNDINAGYTPDEFIDFFQTMYDYMESEGWIVRGITQFFIGEAPQTFAPYAAGWRAYEYLDNEFPDTVRIVSSMGLETSDTVHFLPYDANDIGLRVADASMFGQASKPIDRERDAPLLIVEDMDAAGELSGTEAVPVSRGGNGVQTTTDGILGTPFLQKSGHATIKRLREYSDFTRIRPAFASSTGGTLDLEPYLVTQSGTGASASQLGAAGIGAPSFGRPGLLLSTGTTNTGYVVVEHLVGPLLFVAGTSNYDYRAEVQLIDLPTVDEAYTLEIGFFLLGSAPAFTQFMGFRVSQSSTEWRTVVTDAAGDTTPASGVTAQTATTTAMRVWYDNATAKTRYYINGTELASITDATRSVDAFSLVRAGFILKKTAGTTARKAIVLRHSLDIKFAAIPYF